MEISEIVRTAAMLVAFAVAVSRGRKIWMMADAGAVLLFGVAWLVMPGVILGQMTTGPLGAFHLTLSRMFGALLIGTVVTFYKTRNSGDITVSNVLLYSRVVGISMQLMAVGYGQMYYRDLEKGGWTSEQVWYGLFGGGVWLLGNLYHSARNDQFGCYSQRNDRLSFVLRLDGFLCLLLALADFAFGDLLNTPFMMDAKPDGIHLHMTRCNGAVTFMSALVSSWAPVFLKDEDKRNVLLGRIVQNVLMTVITLHYMWSFYSTALLSGLAFGVGQLGLLAFGYLAPTGKKTA
ncbi:Hypp4707 [Branchiostoma lanceolatum]|uniref:Hypp4707 protein n=1 Tax=Branchiostoma lanceolatum TaxID=7740 RepID=A0A8K0AA15_BRALA|nr:Hypp4707 [Branchiostoma lanceolatum]